MSNGYMDRKRQVVDGAVSFFSHQSLTASYLYWLNNFRWAFIDLSAGPFAWGPAVGGQGVRTEQSLPNVMKTIGAVAGIAIPFFP